MRILHHLNSQKFWLKHDWLGRLTFVFSGASGDFQRTTTIQRTSDWTQVYNDVFMLHSLLQISTESSRVESSLLNTFSFWSMFKNRGSRRAQNYFICKNSWVIWTTRSFERLRRNSIWYVEANFLFVARSHQRLK